MKNIREEHRNFYVTRQWLADYLDIPLRSVDRLRAKGLIRGVKIGNYRRYSIGEIRGFLLTLQRNEKVQKILCDKPWEENDDE